MSADTFSDCLSSVYSSVLEDASSSEYTSDSDDVNIRPTKRQKRKKPLGMDSDAESEYATHGAGQGLTRVTGVTLASVNETTEFISGWLK